MGEAERFAADDGASQTEPAGRVGLLVVANIHIRIGRGAERRERTTTASDDVGVER